MNDFICRVLSIQRHKNTSFLYISGLLDAKQLVVNNELLSMHDVGVMSIIKGKYSHTVNDKGNGVCQIISIDYVLPSAHNKTYHKNFTNKAVLLRRCKADILQQIALYLEKEQFQRINSPFTVPYRGTSIATPLSISGKYVDMYCKITHEFFLKKEMAENLIPVFEIGYVARDVYSTMSGHFEYSILEFVSPLHNIKYIEDFIYKFIEIAINSAEKYQIPYRDLSNIKTIVLDENACFSGKTFDQIKSENQNVLFVNAPTSSPLVKQANGKRTETIWFYNGDSIAHGYRDENDYNSLMMLSRLQMEALIQKGVKAEYSKDFLSLLRLGIPESISIGFGIDRFFQIFFCFDNINGYNDMMCHSGEY